MVDSSTVREIDISRPANALRLLRAMDYLLVIVCSNYLVLFLTMPLLYPNMTKDSRFVLTLVVLVPVLSFIIYTGWRRCRGDRRECMAGVPRGVSAYFSSPCS